jgi:hypothetical protein
MRRFPLVLATPIPATSTTGALRHRDRSYRNEVQPDPDIRIGFFLPYSTNSNVLVWLGKLGGVIRAYPNPNKILLPLDRRHC